jgi:hypothetical protein
MIELDLRRELDIVAQRFRRRRMWTVLAASWTAFALAGLAILWWATATGRPTSDMAGPLAVVGIVAAAASVFFALRRGRSSLAVARRIEGRFPELDARLLTAVAQRADSPAGRLGYLQHTVVDETLAHARRNAWDLVVSDRSLLVAKLAQIGALCGFAVVLGNLMLGDRQSESAALVPDRAVNPAAPITIKIEPGDTSIERGTGLLVLARFDDRLPGEVRLVHHKEGSETTTLAMTKSLDDPVFGGRVLSVDRDLTYSVHFDDEQTRWYKVTVFDYPDLVRADARLAFPEYTGMEETVVEDVRSVTAVEGTKLTLVMRLNKPVADARLTPIAASARQGATKAVAANEVEKDALELSADSVDPNTYTASLVLEKSRRFRLELVDHEGRKNKQPPEFAIHVTPNRPPDVKLLAPARDSQVSPLEELALKARLSDDFGLLRYGLSFSMAGEPPQEVVLGEKSTAKERREVAHTIAFEEQKAEPDQLLSYYFWAEDTAPDGTARRVSGDMFFAEVRPFEEIFRQGQQPTDEEQMQQSQQGQQAGQNARQAEQLADLQKQIINATWKLIRREISQKPTDKFAEDVQLIGESQASAKEQATAMEERLEDPRSKAFLDAVLKHMDTALAELVKAKDGPEIDALQPALAAEQAAYQALLKLRAREHEVVRANRRQQRSSQGSAGANRSQRQLDQLDLANDNQNRYETQRSASSLRSPEQEAQDRETRQVLNRLRELAQRQEDLNRQIQELQTQLEEAKDRAAEEEIRRQLARLRDREQEILRDTDELRDRMEQPENQERMAESRQQLDQTRNDIRRASEALEQGMVPEAAAAGARAGEELNRLRDEFRQANAGQFNEQVDQLRGDARQLDERQDQLAERLSNLDQSSQRTLRDSGERRQITEGLDQQKQDLQKLLEDMRKTIEEAEATEPLLSKQLYDTVRETRRQQPERALEASSQLLERGFIGESRTVEREAGRGIRQLREGVDQAAESVLGDETEGLRRARRELDSLAEQLDREINRARGGDAQQNEQGEQNTADGQQRGQPNGGQQQDGQQQGGQQQGEQQQDRGQQGGQQDGQQQGGQQRGQQGGQQQGRQQQGGQQQGGQQQGGQQRGDQQGGQQNGEQQDGQQQGGQQQGGQQQGGQQQGEQQQDGQQGGQRGGQQQGGQQRGGRQQGGQQSGQQNENQRGGNQQGGLREAGQPGERGEQAGGNRGGDLRRFLGGETGPGGNPDPLTGEGFRDWTDRLRDVEEMVGDPRLRAEAARIRDRATAARAEFKRHSKEPNWDLVQEFIGRPLVELRKAVSEELMRRESKDALVPIDREPVPPEFTEQVRRYYERLGSGQ